MSQEPTMEKFDVSGLDCAVCAAKIEEGLNRLDGVEDAVFDLAGLTLRVKTGNVRQVVEAVRRIDPQVRLVPRPSARPAGDVDGGAVPVRFRRELAWLVLAGLLFLFQVASLAVVSDLAAAETV